MCRVFEVSTSGYYAWRSRGPSRRARQNERLTEQIKMIYHESDQTYGSPRIYRALRARGERCGRSRVERLMRRSGLRSKAQRRFKATTDSGHRLPVSANLLKRNFDVRVANTVWASDITYIWTREGWIYLAVVLDVYPRRIVGYSIKRRLGRAIVIEALQMALSARQVRRGLIHHSDRGSQYASSEYQGLLRAAGLRGSMSGTGNCYDNAVWPNDRSADESFFSTIKKERVYRRTYATREEARQDIFRYIAVFYNQKRLHSTLDYLSPAAYEARNALPRAA